MNEKRLSELLERVRSGEVAPDAAVKELVQLPFADLGYARVDHHRALRQGMPEVIFGESKTVDEIEGISREIQRGGHNVLVTRLSRDKADVLAQRLPELRYAPRARVGTLEHQPIAVHEMPSVAVITAGTSDISVAEEATETLRMLGIPAVSIFDVGVAGIHRVVGHLDVISDAPAVIVVAGMEGALASVVGGMAGGPVVAVPTSVGYGAALSGFTALMGMLTGCASGVTVVNIDNGFGAAMAVARIVRSVRSRETTRG